MSSSRRLKPRRVSLVRSTTDPTAFSWCVGNPTARSSAPSPAERWRATAAVAQLVAAGIAHLPYAPVGRTHLVRGIGLQWRAYRSDRSDGTIGPGIAIVGVGGMD